jgi:hypothetical protein
MQLCDDNDHDLGDAIVSVDRDLLVFFREFYLLAP